MKEYLTLLKMQLAAQYGFAEMKKNKKLLGKRIGLLAVIAFAVAQLLVVYSLVAYAVFTGSKQIGAPEIVLTLSSTACAFAVFLFGVFVILTILFFAKDSEFLLSLPVRQNSIFASKFTIVMLREYPLMLFIMLPPVIICGAGLGLPVLFYLKAVVVVLLLPLIPLAVSALLSMLLMRVAARMRHREVVATVGGILLFVLIMAGQFMLNRLLSSPDSTQLLRQLTQKGGAVELMSRYYPPSLWVTDGLMLTGVRSLLYMLLFAGVSIAAFVLVLLLSSLIYQKGAQAQFETAKAAKTHVKLRFKSAAPAYAIFKNEWISILKTPIYAMNILVGILIAPFVMVMPLIADSKSSDGFAKLASLGLKAGDSVMMLVLTGIIMVFAPMNPAPSTAISREGKCMWLMKTVPLAPRTQILGKFYCGYSISALIALACAAVFAVVYHASALAVTGAAVLSLEFVVATTAISLIIDTLRPKLNWDNPQEAIKQNMNVLAAMLLSFLLAGVLAVPGIFFVVVGLPMPVIFIVYFLLLGGLAVALMAVLFGVFESKFYKMSV